MVILHVAYEVPNVTDVIINDCLSLIHVVDSKHNVEETEGVKLLLFDEKNLIKQKMNKISWKMNTMPSMTKVIVNHL